MTFSFTEREYAAELRKVIKARGPQYRGAVPEGSGSCSYLPADLAPEVRYGSKYMIDDSGEDSYPMGRASEDRCVHGEALHNLGVSDEILAAHEKNTIVWLLRAEAEFSSDFVLVMQVLQARQDDGDEYGMLLPLLDTLEF